MLRIYNLTLIFAIALLSTKALAQNSSTKLQKESINKAKADSIYKTLFNRRGKSIFAELGGPGAAYSINYDTRFANRINGFGARAGISYYPRSHDNALILPILLNHLFGKRSHFFETGAGVILYHYRSDNNYDRFFDSHVSSPNYYYDPEKFYLEGQPYQEPKVSEYGAIYSVTLGYRYQPINGGVMIRAGAGPIFNSYRVLLWPYLSIGYTFKK